MTDIAGRKRKGKGKGKGKETCKKRLHTQFFLQDLGFQFFSYHQRMVRFANTTNAEHNVSTITTRTRKLRPNIKQIANTNNAPIPASQFFNTENAHNFAGIHANMNTLEEMENEIDFLFYEPHLGSLKKSERIFLNAELSKPDANINKIIDSVFNSSNLSDDSKERIINELRKKKMKRKIRHYGPETESLPQYAGSTRRKRYGTKVTRKQRRRH